MKLLHSICCILPLVACSANSASYVVLNRSDNNSLVRVSTDGHSIGKIAERAGGYSLVKDNAGNYIVAAVSSLLRVTPSGNVTMIAKASRTSQWICVVQDSEGVFVVVDNKQHAVWRVSEDGRSVAKVANYAEDSPRMEDVGIILDESGDYLVMEDNHGSRFWRIKPSGEVRPVLLHGIKMASVGHIIAEGDGSYLVGSYRDDAVFRMNRAGEVTKFADVDGNGRNMISLARNPDTGEVVGTQLCAVPHSNQCGWPYGKETGYRSDISQLSNCSSF